jgi:hypothetical protein
MVDNSAVQGVYCEPDEPDPHGDGEQVDGSGHERTTDITGHGGPSGSCDLVGLRPARCGLDVDTMREDGLTLVGGLVTDLLALARRTRLL